MIDQLACRVIKTKSSFRTDRTGGLYKLYVVGRTVLLSNSQRALSYDIEALETDYPRIREVVAIFFGVWQVVADGDLVSSAASIAGVCSLIGMWLSN